MNRFPYPTMRDRFDLRAYFVVGPDDTKGRPVADVVAAALRGGVTFIQLRAKHADAREREGHVLEVEAHDRGDHDPH